MIARSESRALGRAEREAGGDAEPLGLSARKHGAAVRAFFAIAVEGELRDDAAGLARALAARPGGEGIRWVAPESYHLTLRFLGNLAASAIPALAEHAHDALAGCAAFPLTLSAPQAFPARRPRVVMLAAQPEPALAELAARLDHVARAHGVAPEARAFHAHLTLGRVRASRAHALSAPAPAGTQQVREVVLFRSDLTPDGSRYSPLAALPLGA